MSRDSQKGRVYAWERTHSGNAIWKKTMELPELESYVKRIWRGERGRYGKAKMAAPFVQARRGSSAVAFYSHKLVFGTHCHNAYVALHEIAHRLDKNSNQGHGSRFVGILIGLLSRHMGYDSDALLYSALDAGLKVDVRSIGAVPAFPWAKRVAPLLPATAIEIASDLGISYRVVHGAALQLIKTGRAKWRGKVLVATGS